MFKELAQKTALGLTMFKDNLKNIDFSQIFFVSMFSSAFAAIAGFIASEKSILDEAVSNIGLESESESENNICKFDSDEFIFNPAFSMLTNNVNHNLNNEDLFSSDDDLNI